MDEIKFLEKFEQVAKRNGIEVYRDGRLNFWGIRTPQGEFNDFFKVWYYDGKKIVDLPLFKGTTEPGKSWLQNVLGNPKGTAVLIHNRQYKDCWMIGKHKGKYEALVQSDKSKFTVWRDNNKDGDADYSAEEYYDVGGLNFHSTKLGYSSNWIGNFSAGCQVAWDYNYFSKTVMPFIKNRNQKYYSYALVLDSEF